MRNITVNTICTLALSTILTVGINAAAQVDPNMEAGVECSTADCMFRSNPQTRDAVSSLSRIPSSGARLQKINRFETSPEQIVNRVSETQFAPIGEVESPATATETAQFGTGILVSPCFILTNHHAAYGDDLRPIPGKVYASKFRAGASQTNAFAGNTTATAVLGGNFDVGGKNDWALMKLNSCIGRRADFGWMEAAQVTAQSLIGKDVAVAGYATDRERGQLSLSTGKVEGFDAQTNMMMFSASTAPGTSGAAVLAFQDGQMKLAGLNVGALVDKSNPTALSFRTYAAGRANEFINAADILNRADVKMILDADKAEFGQPNPWLQRSTRPLPRTQMASI